MNKGMSTFGNFLLPEQRINGLQKMSEFPIVVCYDREWVELACFICSLNRNSTGNYLNGWRGLRLHLVSVHEEEIAGKTDEELLESCIQRRFCSADVRRMHNGEQPEDGGPIIDKRKPYKPRTQVENAITAPVGEEEDEESITVATPASKKASSKRLSHLVQDAPAVNDEEEEGPISRGRKRRPAGTFQRADVDGARKMDSTMTKPENNSSPFTSIRSKRTEDGNNCNKVPQAPGNIVAWPSEETFLLFRINCIYCNANASSETREFFDRTEGIQDHLRSSHGRDLQWSELLKHCKAEELTQEQVDTIIRGDARNGMVFAPDVIRPKGKEPLSQSTQRRVELEPKAAVPIGPDKVTKKQAPAPVAIMTTAASKLDKNNGSRPSLHNSPSSPPMRPGSQPSSQPSALWFANNTAQTRKNVEGNPFSNAVNRAHASGQQVDTSIPAGSLTGRTPSQPPHKKQRKYT